MTARAAIGVLGGGQLGRMLALAGYPLGLRFRFLDPSPDAPAGHVGELMSGSLDDAALLARFARGLDCITYEWESVPAQTVRSLSRQVPVYPPPEALETAQDRLREKEFFRALGLPTPGFVPVASPLELEAGVRELGLPAVLKTRRLGYDGKGQRVLRRVEDAAAAWDALGGVPLILEAYCHFDREVALLAARSRGGETAFYPLVENHHADGILRLSLAPAVGCEGELQARAEAYGRAVLEALDYAGVLAIEFFEVGGRLVANEMAPRVHNSGHWTTEGAATSQFENHLRAILGLPLGATDVQGCAAMLNLIGSAPRPEAILATPGAHLHLYGKAPRAGRKVGHVTLRGENPAALLGRVRDIMGLTGESAVRLAAVLREASCPVPRR